jgi:hypothetical protein
MYVVFKASNSVVELFSDRHVEGVMAGFEKSLMIGDIPISQIVVSHFTSNYGSYLEIA